MAVADFRGHANLVVFFSHGQTCAACRALAQVFVANEDRLRELDTEVLVVLPGLAQGQEHRSVGIHKLADPRGVLRRQYAELVQSGLHDTMLFVLDRYTTPYVAWVGREPDAEALYPEALEWLEYVELQCPE
jgi:hypothetical protein